MYFVLLFPSPQQPLELPKKNPHKHWYGIELHARTALKHSYVADIFAIAIAVQSSDREIHGWS